MNYEDIVLSMLLVPFVLTSSRTFIVYCSGTSTQQCLDKCSVSIGLTSRRCATMLLTGVFSLPFLLLEKSTKTETILSWELTLYPFGKTTAIREENMVYPAPKLNSLRIEFFKESTNVYYRTHRCKNEPPASIRWFSLEERRLSTFVDLKTRAVLGGFASTHHACEGCRAQTQEHHHSQGYAQTQNVRSEANNRRPDQKANISTGCDGRDRRS